MDGCALFYKDSNFSHFYPIYYDDLQHYLQEMEGDKDQSQEKINLQQIWDRKEQYYLRKNIGLVCVFHYNGILCGLM